MANGANIVVPVGVQLELNNVQDIISSLQKAMSNVKPDTKGYSSIVSELSKAEKRADALASKLKQGFTTNAGIQSFTKGFEDLIAMVDTVNSKIGQINFDNLTLTADQQAKMAEFTKNIQDAQNAYNAFETSKLKDAVSASQELQNVFKKLNLNIDTTSLDTAINSIKTKIASLQKEMDAQAKKATANETRATSRQSEIDELNKLKKLFTSKDLSKTFPEFFKTDGNFKNGGKQAFVNLLEQLGIDNDTINLVKKTAGAKIKEIQQEMEKAINARVKTKEGQRNTASDNAKAARDAVDQLTAQQKEQIAAQQELSNLKNDSGMVQAREQETQVIEQENVKIRELIKLVMEAFNGGLGKNSNDLKTALDTIRESGGAAAAELERLNQKTKAVNNIKQSISMWMGFNQVLRLSRTAIRNMVKDIRDLDKVMTEIAVVTNMSQKDLWNQMNTYQGIAKQYGVATTGVYQVSQIYYQQGLQTSEVMNLTNETLKMAKIAGLDYSAAADYMTVAIRGFKMEMTDAQKVVDVYSNLAAKSASDTTELATAMSKTASSAAAVGSSFENTSAMIAMMVETTRESAENIGSALKSIISRYGEMTSDPSKLIDSEGEALSLNKVDKALQSVGISLHNAQGQFRDFDEVILELSSKWNTLDKNSQRYIATIMAGNRQQSRFLALVSDYDRLSELTEEAANSEDAALVQTLKTMDSLETKIQNVKNAFQGFYGNLGLESVFKGALDAITSIINRLNAMPKIFGKIPIAAIGMVANIINVIKTLGTTLITVTTAKWQQISEIIKENIARGFKEGADEGSAAAEGKARKIGTDVQYNKKKIGFAAAGRALSMAGTAASTYALTIDDAEAEKRGKWEIGGGLLTGIGQGIATGALTGGIPGAIIGTLTGIAAALPSVITGFNDLAHAEELAIEAARKRTEQSKQEAILAKSEANNLENTVEKLQKLSDAKNESNEAYQEWIDYVNQVASEYPELISMYDSEGNAVIEMANAYEKLAHSRSKAAQANLDAQIDELNLKIDEINRIKKLITEGNYNFEKAGDTFGSGLENIKGATKDADSGDIKVVTTGNQLITISSEFVDQIFENLNTAMAGASGGILESFNLKSSSINTILNWTTDNFDNNVDELEKAKMVMADLYYQQFIKPLANEGYLSKIGYDNEDEIKKAVEGLDPSIITARYLRIMDQINKTVESDAELQEKIAELESKKRSADLALTTWVENNINALDNIKLSNFTGDSLIQSLVEKSLPEKYIKENGELNAAGEKIVEELYNFYNSIDEETYKQITSLLAHPENYTSQDELTQAFSDILGSNLGEQLINYINIIGEDGSSYLQDIWKRQVESIQERFTENLNNGKFTNDSIKEQANLLSTIGDKNVSNSEIAAQYLNNINKQWTDLVTNQKNEVVATQNAKFLADTYIDVGQLSEEANGAMAGILSSAELNTREGIQKAIDQIEAYQATTNLSEPDASLLNAVLNNLKVHKENLLLNLNTEIQFYTDSLGDAIKSINTNYNKNTSGFDDDLKDANEILSKINVRKAKTGQEQLDFNEVFKFNETLGKYVFTIKGLQEANNQVMQDLDDQYADITDQLDQEKIVLDNLFDTGNILDKDKKMSKLQIMRISSKNDYTEEQQAYLESLASRWATEDKTWKQFIDAEKERLEQLGINIDQAKEAAQNMTKKVQQQNAFKAINFTEIVKGSQTFEEAKQSLLNYYETTINKDLPQFIQDAQMKLAEVVSQIMFNQIKSGGQVGLDAYRLMARLTGQETDKNTENEIYNQRIEAINSLHNKIQKATGQQRIQLDDAERVVLGTKARDIGATELAEKYAQLIDEVRQGVKNGQTDLETANAAIIDQEFEEELSMLKKTSALTSIGSSKITPESIKTLANTMGVLSDLPDNFSISQLKGINEEGFINNIQEFLTSFNELLQNKLTEKELQNIESSLELADKSKITDAAIQAENSIIESIASEINNIKSAGIGKKVNLTYLTNKLGADNLKSIFGDAYQNGVLTVTNAVKANMYDSLNEVRTILKAKGGNTNDLDKTLQEYINTAMSEISEFTGKMVVSDETASVLAARSPIFANQLKNTGKITINSIEEFVNAANAIYMQVRSQYYNGLADLTKLNSAYANIIKGNLAKQTAGFNMLTSASKIDLSSLQNFLNTYNEKLSKYVDRMGNLTSTGAEAGLKNLGNGNYQIADWHKFISQLQITANELSTDYIDAYISWLQSDVNVAPNAKEALMTSLIPNMEKLTYAQIGQIAKTFNMTVDQVLALVENNGDNTFNGSALLNTLDFDKHNQEFKQALTEQYSEITNNLTSALVSFVESDLDGKRTGLDFANLDKAVNDYTKAMRSLGKDVEIDLYNLKMRLVLGGESAVAAGQEIAKFGGVELSAQDIETLYRGAITRYVNTIDTVVAKPGEIVDEATASIIKQAGGKVNELGTTGQYVVETAANLYEAYNDLLHRMAATGEATLADLNKVAALALENRDGEQQVIDALGDAAGMTFTRFGEILADAGIQLTESMIDNLEAAGIIDLMGGNKMKIVDFQAFADLMHWDADSEEYVSAFKSYNDSLIEMNRQAERNILEEAESVADAKGGDLINLTQLSNLLEQKNVSQFAGTDFTALDKLNSVLRDYGAFINKGILQLDDSANIPAIMQEIAKAAAESGGLLSNELAELADAVADVIKGYADLISGAISGSLSNVQAEQLQDWATTNGIGELNFTETADGLKVATDQAFELVAALQKVDSMQSNLTFNNLVDSLSADKGGKFENISKTTAEIAKAQREIAENNQKIDFLQKDGEEVNKKDIASLKEKNAQLREQVSLYRQIQQRQSIDPSQYNFMDRDLPEMMQGPINYWNSVGQAYSALNETAQTGKMDIQDFTNIVNEMSNLAATSSEKLMFFGQEIDGSAENAAALIQKGYNALSNVDGKGVKVDLSKMGIDFAAGADNAKNNFDKGVKSLAESQIAMLDAAIQVLEVVVAMEELGNIDVDNNGIFSIGDIFGEQVTVGNGEKIDAYTTEFQDYATKILKAAETNEDLRKGLENFSVNGITLKEMFEDATDRLKDLDISKEAYFSIMNAFVEAARNGDYNLDTIQDSVWQILDQTLPDGSIINIGTRSIVISGGTHLVINWEDPNVQKVVDEIKNKEGKTEEEAKQQLTKDFSAYQTNTADTTQVERVLTAKGIIKTDIENGGVDIDGQHFNTIDSQEAQEAIAKAALKDNGIENIKEINATENEGKWEITAIGAITVGEQEIAVNYNNGAITYHSDITGQNYSSMEELFHAEFMQSQQEAQAAGFSGYASEADYIKVRYGEKVAAELYSKEIKISNEEDFKNRTQSEVNTLASALATGSDEDVVNAAKTVGIDVSVTGELTADQRSQIAELAGITSETKALNVAISVSGDGQEIISKVLETSPLSNNLEINVDSAKNTLDNFVNDEIETEKKKPVDLDITKAKTTLSSLTSSIEETVNKYTDIYARFTEQYNEAIKEATKDVDKTVNIKTKGSVDTGPGPKAGNVAFASGRARAAGNTLMGELGPELVVSHGRYFVVGQNGPEMVNLAEDAIVFNHLQTQQLLKHGKASGHAKPVTNERKATSLATGNAGPAMASASAALDTLKQLRSMWQSLLNASLKDLGAMGGAGGGGGGGGGGDNNTKGVLKDIERWYNWLKQIEATQTKINKLTKEYTLLEKQGAKTAELAVNLQKQAANLNKNIKTRTALVEEQTGYRDSLLDQVRGKTEGGYNLLSAFYKVGKNNELQIKDDKRFEKYLKNGVSVNAREFYSNKEIEESDGKIKAGDVKNTESVQLKAKNGLELMEELQKQDQYGNLIYSAEDQLKVLKQLGLGKYLEKDASGNVLKDASEKVEYFFAQLESGEKEISDLTSSIDEGEQSILDDKIALEEINDQLVEMSRPVQGVTEHLEEWYNFSRQIVEAQNKLNKLTAEYNNLIKSGANADTQYKNLQNQIKTLMAERDSNEKKIQEQEKKLKSDKKSIKKSAAVKSGIYTFDDAGNLVADNSKEFKKNIKKNMGKKVKGDQATFTITTRKMVTDKEGNYVKDKNGVDKYKESSKKIQLDISNSQDFINKLTSKDAYGNSKFTDQQQAEILVQAGFGKSMQYVSGEKFFDSVETATQDELNAAAKAWLEWVSQVPEEYNKAADEIKAAKVEQEELKGQILETNNSIRELYKVVPGIISGLDKWYNYTRKIADAQNSLNTLIKKYTILQKDNIANGYEIYTNLQAQLKNNKEQYEINADFIKARKKDLKNYKQQAAASGLNQFFTETSNGTWLFRENGPAQNISYKKNARIKTNDEGYQVDVNGQYVDKEGVLRDKNGKEVTDPNAFFGELALEKGTKGIFKSSGNLLKDLETLNQKDLATGEVLYDSVDKLQILKGLGYNEAYMRYDEGGNLIYSGYGAMTSDEMDAAVQTGVDRVRNIVESVNESQDDIVKLTQKNLDLESETLELQQILIDNTISLKDQLKEAVVQEHQDAIDQKKELVDAIQDAGDKTVQGLRDSLDKERKLYNNDQNEKDLVEAQMKLAALQTSGASLTDIRDAQKAVQEKQTDIYFNQREQEISNIEEANKTQVELLQNEIDILQSTLDYQVKYGLIWEEVNSKLATWDEQTITDYIAQHDKDLFSSSTESQQEELNKVLESAQLFKAADVADLVQSVKDGLDKSVIHLSQDSLDKLNKYITDLVAVGTPLETAIEEANKYLNNLLEEEELKKEESDIGLKPTENAELVKSETVKNIEPVKPVKSEPKKEDEKTKKNNIIKNALKNLKSNDEFQSKDAKEILASDEIQKIASKAYDNSKAASNEDKQKAVEKAIDSAVREKLYSFSFPNVWKDFQAKYGGLLNQLDKNRLTALKEYSQNVYNSSKKKTLKEKAEETISSTLKYAEFLAQQLSNVEGISNQSKGEKSNKISEESKSTKVEPVKTLDKKTGKTKSTKTSNKEPEKTEVTKVPVIKPIAKSTKPAKPSSQSKDAKSTYTAPQVINITKDVKPTKENVNRIINEDKAAGGNSAQRAVNTAVTAASGLGKAIFSIGTTLSTVLKKLPGFDKGGTIDYTGLAIVHGSKTKPEYIFNSQQMEILKSGLYNNVNLTNSLVSSYNSALGQIANGEVYNTDNGITIEHAEVNLNIDKVASDYDSRRMGEQALNEMVRIARKSGNRSISRR